MKQFFLAGLLVWMVLGAQAQVVMNEIQADPGNYDGNGGEWIELKNIGTQPEDLSCWRITNGGSYKLTIPSGLVLPAGAYLLIGDASKMACATCDFPGLNNLFSLNANGFGNGAGNYANTIFLNTDLQINGGCNCMDGNGTLNNGNGNGDRIVLFDATGTVQDALQYANGDYYGSAALSVNYTALGACPFAPGVSVPAANDAIYAGKTICNDQLSCNSSFARLPDGNNAITWDQSGNLACVNCLQPCVSGALNTASTDYPTPGLSNNTNAFGVSLNGNPVSVINSSVNICGAQAQTFEYLIGLHQNVALQVQQSNGNLGSYVQEIGTGLPQAFSTATYNAATGTTQLSHTFTPPIGTTVYEFVWADGVTQCAVCPGSTNQQVPSNVSDENKECFVYRTLTVNREDVLTGVASVTCALPGAITISGLSGSNIEYKVQKQTTSGGAFTDVLGPQSSNIFGGIIDDDADPNLPNYQVVISTNNTFCANNTQTVAVPTSCLGNPACPIYETSGAGVPTFSPGPGLVCAGSTVTFDVGIKGVCTGGQVEVLYDHNSLFDPYTQGTSLGTVNTTVGATPAVTTATGIVYISEFVPRPYNVAPCASDGTNPNSGEYVELYNAGPGNTDVSGWMITDGDWTVTIPQGTVLNANSYYLIGGGGTFCYSGVVPDLNVETCNCTGGTNTAGTDFMNLTNSTEWLGLYDCGNNFIDGLYWGTIGTQSTSPPATLAGGCGNYLTSKTPVYPGLTATVPAATQLENTGGSFSGSNGGRARNGSGLWSVVVNNSQFGAGFNGTPKAVNGAFVMWNGTGTPLGSQCPPPPVNASITVNLPDTCNNLTPVPLTLKAIYRPDPVFPCTESAVTAQANYIIPPCAIMTLSGSAEYCAPATAPLTLTMSDPLIGNHDVTLSNGSSTVSLTGLSGTGPFGANVTQTGTWVVSNILAPLGTCPPKVLGQAQVDIYQTPVVTTSPVSVSNCYAYGYDLAVIENQIQTNPVANSFIWYDQAIGGSPINTFVNPSATTTYYVAPSAGINISCEGARVPVDLILDPLPAAPSVFCNGTQVTFIPQSPDCFPVACSNGIQYSLNGSIWSNGPTFTAADPGWAGWGSPGNSLVYIRNTATPACYTPVSYILPCSAPLPAYIVDLGANLNAQSGADIVWNTKNEYQVKQYVVERSADGFQFEDRGVVNAKGNSSLMQSYVFVDRNLPNGKWYYRIRTEDLDGQKSWTHSVMLEKNAEQENRIQCYPSPVSKQLGIGIHSSRAERSQISLIDLSGRVLFEQAVSLKPGMQQIEISVDGFAKGVYLMKFTNRSGSQILKWMKE